MTKPIKYLNLLLLSALLLHSESALAAPSTQELQATLQSLQKSKKEAEKIKQKLEATKQDLAKLQEQATINAKATQQAELNANFAEQKLAKTIQELDQAQAEFELKRDAYMHTIRHLITLQRLPASAFFGSDEEVRAMLKTAAALEVVHKALASKAKDLQTIIKRLNGLKTRLINDRSYSAKRQQRLQQQYQALNDDLQKRQQLQEKLASDHEKARARVKQLAAQSHDLQDLISKLEIERRQKAASALPILQAPTVKGQWRAPVAGKILHRFGEKKPGGDVYRGMVFAARPGGSVIAPNAGEVVFTGPFRDYGPMVLLRHREGYISLLAGLADIRVALGQAVRANEPIGRMGTGTNPSLYVELRQSGKTIDPAAWFANLITKLSN